MRDSQEIVIKKAEKKDLNQIYLFERQYMIEFEKGYLKRWDDAKMTIEKGLIDNIDRMFIAVNGEEIIGHIYWSMLNDVPCVFSIFIIEEFRKKGISKLLMDMVEGHVAEEGYDRITLATLESNPAQYVYEKRGYKESGRKDGNINYIKVL